MRELNFKKILIIIAKIGLSLLAFYIIYQKVAFEKVGFYIKQATWLFLFLAFSAFFISKAIAALRINCYYRTQQLFLPEILNLKLTLLAIFYNLFVPMVGGEGYRVYWLNQRSEAGIKALIAASFLDRISGLLVLFCLAILFFPFTGIALPYKSLVIIAIPLIYGIYYFIHRWLFKSFQLAWWKVTAYSILVQSLQITCTFFILLALHVNHQMVDYLFIFLLSSMAFVLPFMGAREMAFIFGASFLGLDADLSLTISLFFFFSMAITSLTGLFFFFFPSLLAMDKTEYNLALKGSLETVRIKSEN